MSRSESKQPTLRISNIVRRRQQAGWRVRYFVDPSGEGLETAVAETVVLKRWRRRVLPGYRFRGDRLSSTTWRALRYVFAEHLTDVCAHSLRQLDVLLAEWRPELRRRRLGLPSAHTLHAILQVVGADRLAAILQRHCEPGRAGHSGVPDLFLYAVRDTDGQYAIARFVEVKRPNERLSPDQEEEIAFLQSLGLPARVLRLQER